MERIRLGMVAINQGRPGVEYEEVAFEGANVRVFYDARDEPSLLPGFAEADGFFTSPGVLAPEALMELDPVALEPPFIRLE